MGVYDNNQLMMVSVTSSTSPNLVFIEPFFAIDLLLIEESIPEQNHIC
jgi:hypothetical protein